MCGSRRRAQRLAMANQMACGVGPQTGLLGAPRTCGHACDHGCQSGCSHACQHQGCQSMHGHGYGYGAGMGGCGRHAGGCCCGRRRRHYGLIGGVVVPLVRKGIETYRQSKAIKQAAELNKGVAVATASHGAQQSGLIARPAPSSVVSSNSIKKEKKDGDKDDEHDEKSDDELPAYTPTTETSQEAAHLTPGSALPKNPVVEQLVAQLIEAVSSKQANPKCANKMAVQRAAKNLRDELEELEEAQLGRSLNCREWKELKQQVKVVVDEIEAAVVAGY